MRARTLSWTMLFSLLALLGGCECGRHRDRHHGHEEGSGEGEGTEGEGTEGEGEGEGEAPEQEAPAAHPVGPLGWTSVVETETEDGEYVEHRLLLWRTGPASGERPESMELLGHFSNWAGAYTLYVSGSEETSDVPLTLFGLRGRCEATATRRLHLRVSFDPHRGSDEERLYDALELEGCDGPFAFGAEGSVPMVELSTRTMDTPPEEVAAVVADREQDITEESGDEPMRLVGREIPELHVWVLSGWENYVVRGTTIVAHTEDTVIGALTIGERTLLLFRGEDGPELRVPDGDRLERVNPDADPAGSTEGAADDEAESEHAE